MVQERYNYGLSNGGNSNDLESSSRSFPTASFLNVIFCTDMQQLTRFQLKQCVARSLCGSGASCYFYIWCEQKFSYHFMHIHGWNMCIPVSRRRRDCARLLSYYFSNL